MTETTLIEKPYKGLIPYAEEDAPIFFGRETEREIITVNLMAARLTVLYGVSGVGKTSVLRAGVAYHLRQLAQQNLAERGTPEFAIVVFSAWRDDDPIAGLVACVEEAVNQALNVPELEPVSPSPSLTETLQVWTERLGGDLLIILDQFEEYFLYHSQKDGKGTFAVEFPRAVNCPDLRVNFLISIREDALAKLDRFKGRIPNLFANYLRIKHLDLEGARAAIEEPIKKYNELQQASEQPIELELELVNAVLKQVSALTGQEVLGQVGGGVAGGGKAAQIETPFLQLVMTRLWDEERSTGSCILRLETLETRLGGAERIVKTHLDTVMEKLSQKERQVAARAFYYLVTPSGAKIAYKISDLSKYAELPLSELIPVMDKLAEGDIRILRPIPIVPPSSHPAELCYEIFHDVLAQAILDWRARYMQDQISQTFIRPLIGENAAYYKELSDVIELDQRVHYNDSSEHYGKFVVTRGSHAVEVPTAFRIGTYLVSNAFFKIFVDAGGYDVADYWQDDSYRLSCRARDNTAGPAVWPSRTAIPPGLERHPVAGLSFFEAVAFVRWLQSTRTPKEPGWRWTLPTEDMWEYAARGTDGRQYPWGSDWLPGHCNSKEAGVNTTTEVNQYPRGRSAVGCFDMAGNLWEFVDVQDKYPNTCILRGGSFRNNRGEVRSHLRLIHVPKSHRPPDFGFRIAQVFEG